MKLPTPTVPATTDPPRLRPRPARPSVSRGIAAAVFVAGGVGHLLFPEPYRRIVPPYLPSPALLVAVSGVAEVAGGVGLLVPRLRRPAGRGLIALLVAVFPANLHMARHPDQFPAITDAVGPTLAWLGLWLRLPLQVVLILWVWSVSSEGRSTWNGNPGATDRYSRQ